MLKVGITGGIASGKSLIASMFNLLGVPVYCADFEAKRLIQQDEEIRTAIIDLLGKESYDETGMYNTRYVAAKVFNDAVMLKTLGEIVHPKVKEDYLNWAKSQSFTYSLHESALIFEGGFNSLLDKVIVVSTPIDLRLKRLIHRDKLSEQEAVKRINSQFSDKEKERMADYIIYNDARHSVINQIVELHHKLLRISLT
ncbi:MAG: dephospho-CoA kinase [Saprospiraceae bacterium]|nr:dephospho-CoA kinase [Saprospiraceae bacterium]